MLRALACAQNTQKVAEVKEQAEKDRKNLPKMEAKLEALSKGKEEAQAELDAIFETVKGKVEPIRVKMEKKQREVIPLKQRVNEAKQKVDVAEAELKLCESPRPLSLGSC